MNKLMNIFLQVQHAAEMNNIEDTGKFYVVVGVIAVLFVGITAYMISIDMKLKKLEK